VEVLSSEFPSERFQTRSKVKAVRTIELIDLSTNPKLANESLYRLCRSCPQYRPFPRSKPL